MSEKMVKYKYKKPTKPIKIDDSKVNPPYQAKGQEENNRSDKFQREEGNLVMIYNPNERNTEDDNT